MESGGNFLKEDTKERRDHVWIILPFVCFFVVVLGVSCSIILITSLHSEQSTDEAIITVDTLATFHVSTKTTPDIKRLPEEHEPWSSPAPVNTSRAPARIVPPRPTSHGEVCSTFLCRYAAQWLRSKIDYSVNPCKDFYRFVCGSFEGFDEFSHLARGIEVTIMAFLGDLSVPYSNQNSQQKAAGMYQACIAFAKSRRTETHYLVEWMVSLNLDLMNKTRLAAVNPVEMMVRGSLDLGVKAVVAFVLFDRDFEDGKRVMQIEYSKEQAGWLAQRHRTAESDTLNEYASFLQLYGVNPPYDTELALKILGYEKELDVITNIKDLSANPIVVVFIRSIGDYTKPYVTSDEWQTFLSKYTNGLYKASDTIQYEKLVGKIIVNLLKSKSVGEKGLRYLVAWSIYRQLLEYTVPERLFGRSPLSYRHVQKTCYGHVGKVMNMAMKSPYFQSKVPAEMVDQATSMVTRIRSEFRKSLESSSWFTGRDRKLALRKLDNITAYVGSPGNRLDPAFVEKHYKPYPDAHQDRLFPTWIKALSLSTHYTWADKMTWLYDETEVNAFYNRKYNAIVIPTSILERPFFYPHGLHGLNYGSLGTLVGHELMHAFDVEGIALDEVKKSWNSSAIIQEYTKRALCLRQSHKSVLPVRARQEALNDMLDSENLADWVGLITTHAAFASLSPSESSTTLAGLDMSAERLFFVNHCVTWCHQRSRSTSEYAPYRSRCIVPLMNTPEFSSAFGCAPGEPMNPRKKCTFWQ